mgnify:CR=1 FL=1
MQSFEDAKAATERVLRQQRSDDTEVNQTPPKRLYRGRLGSVQPALQALENWYRGLPPRAATWARPAAALHRLARRNARRILRSLRRPQKVNKGRPDRAGNLRDVRHLNRHRPPDERKLRRKYDPLQSEPDTFVLYRIIGNDLYPRHQRGQSRQNVRFILENEPKLPACRKRWILNHIIDTEERRQLISLLESHSQEFTELAFDPNEFCSADWDIDVYPAPGMLSTKSFHRLKPQDQERAYTVAYRKKNNALMHNNAARNHAVEEGSRLAKWVLPWDGNCFVESAGWERLRSAVVTHGYLKHFVVPMERIGDNGVLGKRRRPGVPTEEPQLVFRRDSEERFNEAHPYGRRPKVELLKRLGVPGPWCRWRDDPWDVPSRGPGPLSGQFRAAGSVARLASGVSELEARGLDALRGRGFARQAAIRSTISHVMQDRCTVEDCRGLSTFRRDTLDALRRRFGCKSSGEDVLFGRLTKEILEHAERALRRAPESVVDKPAPGPSGNTHDYYHPAPYWWPDPARPDGIPFVRRDGHRVPGTALYEHGSERYDRSRLQRLFDDSTALVLSWRITGEPKYADQAVAYLRHWFIDQATKMTPHLRYAQVRRGHDNDEGHPRGIIEMKDLYYYLDCVHLLAEDGKLSEVDCRSFKSWLSDYYSWLTKSSQGTGELVADNNHGPYYDLQVAAVALFLEDYEGLYGALIRARDRIGAHYSPNGVPIMEVQRTQTAHYSVFALQGWLAISDLAQRNGDNLTAYCASNGASLQRAVEWLEAHVGRPWPYRQDGPFDADRIVVSLAIARRMGFTVYALDADIIERVAAARPYFDPLDGIRPYWPIELINPVTVPDASD